MKTCPSARDDDTATSVAAATARRARSKRSRTVRPYPLAPRLGEVLLAGLEQDRPPLHLIEDRYDTLLDLRERARAGVLDQPLRTADGGGGVLPARAERARSVAP